ncbi:MAG TPA: CHRD domain-containing protein [Xanthobacteraceae bacterium]|nr:CHRD domain-containing protein [Xanthobacteraceae bacterium]
MRFKMFASVTAMAAPFVLLGANAGAKDFHGTFSGFEETGPLPGPTAAETGAILSPATATVDLDLNRAARTITFKLTFSGFTTDVLQAHIHFGKRHVPGGVIVFFCDNLPNNPPAGTQACPTRSGTVTGTFMAGSVVGPAAQGIPAGDFDGLVAALDSDTAYGNIHTTNHPGGEIRAQIRHDEDDDRK